MKFNNIFLKIAVCLVLMLAGNSAYAQLVAVKTNALLWGNLTPNLSLELVTGQKFSMEGSAFYSPNFTTLDTRLMGVQVEGRYWISGRPMNRLFVGVSLSALRYDTSLGDYRQLGDAAGPGISYGYALPVGKHWNIEFAAGVGMMWFREKRYDKNVDIWKNPYNEHGFKMLPTKLSVSCAYLF